MRYAAPTEKKIVVDVFVFIFAIRNYHSRRTKANGVSVKLKHFNKAETQKRRATQAIACLVRIKIRKFKIHLHPYNYKNVKTM